MFKKICFFILVGFFALAIGFLQYNTNNIEYVKDLYTKHIKKGEYEEVAKIFNDLVDTNSIYEDDTDAADIRIYPGMTMVKASYTENNEQKAYIVYEYGYNFYIFKSEFAFHNISLNDSVENASSIRFTNGDNYYDYYLVVDKEYNSSVYKETAATKEEALLNNGRDYVDSNDSVGFITISFYSTMIDYIKSQIGGDITGVDIMSNEGKVLYSMAITFNFDEQFFLDAKNLLDYQNNSLDEYELADSKEKRAEILDDAKKYLKDWSYKYEDASYYVRLESMGTPAIVIWKTTGSLLLFAVFIVLIYFALFERKRIKRWINKWKGIDEEEENPISPKKESIMIGNVPAEDYEKFVLPQLDEEKENKE